jgi:peptidyl-tRNA hydrolase
VLSKMSIQDRKLLSDTALQAVNALEMIIKQGIDQTMAEFN